MVTNLLTAALTCQGQLPLSDLAAPTYNNSILTDDLISETYTINPSTPPTSINDPRIANSKMLWITTDQAVVVTITTAAAADQSLQVEAGGLLVLASTITDLKFSNASATNAAHIVMVAAVNRIPNPGSSTPGIY